MPTYAEYTEESNAIDYLGKAVGFIRAARTNPQEWKWALLAVHEALYGFLICALKGTDSESNVCFTTKKGHVKLIGFDEALRRCQDSARMATSGFRRALSLSDDEKSAVRRVHGEFRNQFLHYRPVCWSIEVSGMPEIVGRVLDVIQAVTQDMGSYYTHFDGSVLDLLNAAKKAASDQLWPIEPT